MEPHCPVSANWRVISGALRQTLESVTLADLIYPPQLVAKRDSLVNLTGLSSAAPSSAIDGDPLGRTQ